MKTKKILSDVRVVLECPPVSKWCCTLEDEARALESWARDLQGFIRDHRSQDPVHIEVVRQYENVCAFCGTKEGDMGWDESGCPSCCDAGVSEWERHGKEAAK